MDNHEHGSTATAPCVVIVPTFRERDNITRLRSALDQLPIKCDLLVIDDCSDDGTQDVLRQMIAKGCSVSVLERPRKLGLGSAYTLALARVGSQDYQYAVQMDADFSHSPEDIPRLISACRNQDMVIGSRYVQGGSCENWPRSRYLISWSSNHLIRRVLGLPINDATSGFRCMRGNLLRQLPLDHLVSRGFCWQWELNHLVVTAAGRIGEIPICFRQRLSGTSKMSAAIAIESLWRLIQIRWRTRRGRVYLPIAQEPRADIVATLLSQQER